MAPLPAPTVLKSIGRVLDASAQPFLALDLDGRIVRHNSAFANLIGKGASDRLGAGLESLAVDSARGQLAEARRSVLASGEPRRIEVELQRVQGTARVPVEVGLELFRDDEGAPQGYLAFVVDVSERRRAEKALRESEERFRRLYDEAPFGYHELDIEGRVVNINRTECEMLGYRREDMVGRSILDFVAEDERELARQAIAEKLTGKRPLRPLERTYVTSGGGRIIVAIQERYRLDSEGRISGIRSILQDVTDQKLTQAALVASERRARALFEGIEDAVFVHDLSGKILDANPAACKRLGYARHELIGLNTSELDAPDFARGYEDRLQLQLQRGRLSFEGCHQTRDGRLIPVDINTSTILFEDELAVLAVIRDITERKALEAERARFEHAQVLNTRAIEAKNLELSRSEARYRQLTEGCLDAIVVTDSRGNIALFNPAAERAFGYPADEVLGRPFKSLIVEGAGKAGNVGQTIELIGRRKSGESFPMEMSLSAVDIEGESQYIGSIRDQTERQRMRSMLAQSEKLASIGLLSAGVAHEINNPLAFVANNLAVLERDLKGMLDLVEAYEACGEVIRAQAPEAAEKIAAIADDLDWAYVSSNLGRMLSRTREGVQRVASIVQNLRSLARTSPPKKESALLTDVVASAVEMIQGTAKRKGIEIVQNHIPGIRVPCVATQISQVVLNLMVNAIQAVESNHGNLHGQHGLVRVDSAVRGDEATIEVADNGSGIASENLSRLFDPFFTTKPVGEGTGLGLSISHGIVTGHGGRIEVESTPGQGTCFRVVLPIGDAHHGPSRKPTPPSEGPS